MSTTQAKKNLLIEILKKSYKRQYEAIQPIPYIKDRLYCIDTVFVEGGTEYFCVNGKTEKEGTWTRVESYKDIFKNSQSKAKRCIIEAEAGYGKSTVTLQLAYDWCNGVKDSPLRNVEILILLRLRQLGGVENIYRAIKMFLVSNHPRIKSTDIKNIIEGCSSVKVLLDGYDEYPDRDSGRGSDVEQIITMNMFGNFHVTLTTRYLPKNYDNLNTLRARLVGFDDKARDQYIRKAVTLEDKESITKINQALEENPILLDMCQVPLFFVMFAHMTHEKADFQNVKTVTGFFRYMIECFHSHLRNKSLDQNSKAPVKEYETDHDELDKVAFGGLSKENQQLTWSKDDMIKRLGKGFYNHYIAVGILVEEEVFDETNGETKIIVRFYHKVFCEWYACFTLGNIVLSRDEDEWKVILDKIDPFDLQYLYRFSCGISGDAGSRIIEYLQNREGTKEFALLCIFERTGRVDDIKENIRNLCSSGISIRGSLSLIRQNKLQQRSNLQLLEIAAKYDIPISYVWLENCSPTVHQSHNHLIMESGLSLPILSSLQKLEIQDGRKRAVEEFVEILIYSSLCERLEELKFVGDILPNNVPVENIPPFLKSRSVKVWRDDVGFFERLNLNTGNWQVNVSPKYDSVFAFDSYPEDGNWL